MNPGLAVLRWIFYSLWLAIMAAVIYCFRGADDAWSMVIGSACGLVICDLVFWLWRKWRARRRAA